MKLRFLMPLLACLILTIGAAGAAWAGSAPDWDARVSGALEKGQEAEMQLVRLDLVAHQLYDSALAGSRQTAYLHVQQLRQLASQDTLQRIGYREGWSAMRKDAAAIELAIAQGALSSSWMDKAARIRLASDALLRPDKALWLQYEQVMLDDIARIEKAWKRQAGNGAVAAKAAMHSLTGHAGRIETAVMISLGEQRGTELGERVQYMRELLEARVEGHANDEMVNESLRALKAVVASLFEASSSGDEATAPAAVIPGSSSPLSWTLLLGAVICAVLAFTGWRKYKDRPFRREAFAIVLAYAGMGCYSSLRPFSQHIMHFINNDKCTGIDKADDHFQTADFLPLDDAVYDLFRCPEKAPVAGMSVTPRSSSFVICCDSKAPLSVMMEKALAEYAPS